MNLKVCAKLGILIVCLFVGPASSQADPLTTWTLQNSGVTNHLYCLAVGNGRFVAAGSYGMLIYSSNAINWARPELPAAGAELTNGSFQRLRFLNGKFVALQAGIVDTNFITQILTSSDGATWSVSYRTNLGRVSGFISDVAFGNGKFVAVGSNWQLTSTNGINWTTYGRPADYAWPGSLQSIAYGRGQFYAVGVNAVRTSADGVTWTNLSGGGYNRNDLIYAGDVFLHTASNSGLFPTPYYILQLQYLSPGAAGPLVVRPGGIAYADGVFVAVGPMGFLLTAPLSGPWTNRTSTITNSLNEVCYADGIFVGAGPNGAIATTADIRPGLRVKNSIQQQGVPWCVSVECVLGTRYELESSSDLLSWTTLARFTNTTGVVEICDPVGSGQRFYRTKSLSP